MVVLHTKVYLYYYQQRCLVADLSNSIDSKFMATVREATAALKGFVLSKREESFWNSDH
jgi:hypothetical protein